MSFQEIRAIIGGGKTFFVAAMLFALALYGCGSNGSGGEKIPASTVSTPSPDASPSFTTDSAAVAIGPDQLPIAGADQDINIIGSKECIGCHDAGLSAALSLHPDTAAIVTSYLDGEHVIHSTDIDEKTARAKGCKVCHDPIGDGPLLEPYVDSSDVPAGGLAAVTCEVCHGAGGKHFGLGPIPTPTPDYDNSCGKCHRAGFPHKSEFPLADNLVENYTLSGHNQSLAAANASAAQIPALCSRCHSDEGYRDYAAETTGDDANGLTAALGSEAPLTDVSPVQCRTCHDPHSLELRATATVVSQDSHGTPITDANGKPITAQVFSASFNLCTSCHMIFLTYTWDQKAQKFTYQLDTSKTLQHGGVFGGVAHFDDPSTTTVEGFNINAGDDNACLYCHDPHGATKFTQSAAPGIATEWGQTQGFHGDYKGPAFGQEGCTPCHTSETLPKLAAGASYAEQATQPEPIGCVACHDLQAKDTAGDAFALGPRRTVPFSFNNARTLYDQQVAAGNTGATLAEVEGLGDSALCMVCHSGRASTASVNAEIAASSGPYSFVDSHDLVAGATQFGTLAKGAYEFAGKFYASKFEHVASNNLCVDCHDPHTGKLAITTNQTEGAKPCIDCHTNIDPNADYATQLSEIHDIRMPGSQADYDGNGVKEGIYYEVEGLKTQLEAAFTNAGIDYDPTTSPYFFKAGTAHTAANAYTGFTADQLRAAYNLQFITQDPGAYAHNPAYTIEILYDSIQAMGGDVSKLTRDDSGHFDAAAEAFRHWDSEGEVPNPCSKCHSSQGAAYFMDNGTLISPDQYRQYIKGISAGLACETCHSAPFDNGALRSPGPVTADYGFTFPDEGESNICIICHAGRQSGAVVANATDLDTDFSSFSSHYDAAAGTLFRAIGYEFAGQNYGTQAFAHGAIGATTGEGPCIACHMGADKTTTDKHTFSVFDSATTTGVPPTCTQCHTGSNPMSADIVKAQSAGFQDALKLLADQLAAHGIYFIAGQSPYFFTDAAGTTPFTAWPDNNTLGAAFNLNYLAHEQGAFAHNPDYAKRLLFDSIDWLDNGVLDGTITIDAAAYPDAASWFEAAPATGITDRP